jgi:uncharacterized UPF0146 family protein
MNSTRILYEIDNLPAFQNKVFDNVEDANNTPCGDVRLVEDLNTGLIYNEALRPELMIYDKNYDNEQASSSIFQKHLDQVLQIIERIIGKSKIVEVGCGKGVFLEMMQDNGFEVQGYDPTYEGSNPKVIKQYFTPDLGITGKGLILRHVLEHIQDPVSFLKQLSEANGGSGKIYIEVPCFDWICENRVWFDIFYEHVNYFRLSDFHKIFGTVYESGRLFGDQYLYVIADLSDIRFSKYDPEHSVNFPDNFLPSPEHKNGESVIIWGGGSKGVIFSLLMERAGFPVSMVIDINPRKQGKYLPVTCLKVQKPEDVLSDLKIGTPIYVMNSNYLEEIKNLVFKITKNVNAVKLICIDNEN